MTMEKNKEALPKMRIEAPGSIIHELCYSKV